MKQRHVLAVLVTVSSLTSGAGAAPPASAPVEQSSAPRPDETGPAAERRMADEDFVRKAMQGDMAEVELARLAQTKARNRAVQELARTLEREHQNAYQELQSLASRKGIRFEAPLSRDQMALRTELESTDGPEFDKIYVTALINDHRTSIDEYERETDSVDPDIRSYVTKMVLKLREHLQTAETDLRMLG